MSGAATATVLECRQPSHVGVATASLIGTAIARHAALARGAFPFLYFPTTTSA